MLGPSPRQAGSSVMRLCRRELLTTKHWTETLARRDVGATCQAFRRSRREPYGGDPVSVSINEIPEAAAAASRKLRDAFQAILGDGPVGMWLHGGTTFPDRPRQPGDLDICVAVDGITIAERDPGVWATQPESRPYRIVTATQELALAEGVSFDVMCLPAPAVGRAKVPTLAYVGGRRLNGWAVYRAHWSAGQYVRLYGKTPEQLGVVPPTTGELMTDLDRELEHLERHVYEGDADIPYEATYAIWNGCRILHTLETGNAALSKRSAGAWGIQHFPERWHPAIRAAGRSYDGEATREDNEVLRVDMGPFVEMVRERLPVTEPRPPGPPRWS